MWWSHTHVFFIWVSKNGLCRPHSALIYYVYVLYLTSYLFVCSVVVEDLMLTPSIDNRAEVEKMCDLVYSVATTYATYPATRPFALQISEAMLDFLNGEN